MFLATERETHYKNAIFAREPSRQRESKSADASEMSFLLLPSPPAYEMPLSLSTKPGNGLG